MRRRIILRPIGSTGAISIEVWAEDLIAFEILGRDKVSVESVARFANEHTSEGLISIDALRVQ